MKNLFLLFCVIVLVCCSKSVQYQVNGTECPESISAIFESSTRAALCGNEVVWVESDALSLFTGTDANNRYGICQIDSLNHSSALFKFEEKGTDGTNMIQHNYAVYPYREGDNTVDASGVVTTLIKTNQDATVANQLKCAPMVAVSEDYSFEFRNVASLLKFNVRKSDEFSETCILDRIEVESASKSLSGKVQVNTSDSEWKAVPISANNRVALCGAGGSINVEITSEAQSFIVVIPPALYPKDDLIFRIRYRNESGNIITKSVVCNSELSISTGRIQDVDCLISVSQPADTISVTTGGVLTFNGYEHVTCYTASIWGSINGNATESGVLYQRTTKSESTSAGLVLSNVGTLGGSDKENKPTYHIKRHVSECVSGNVTLKLTDLAGGDSNSDYIYRFYALIDGQTLYGDVKSFRTDKYGVFVSVPSGICTMGADVGQDGYSESYKTSPSHTVIMTNSYDMGKYEVTSQEFVDFLNAKGYVPTENTATRLTVKNASNKQIYRGQSGVGEGISLTYIDGVWGVLSSRRKLPLERVTWQGAVDYCVWLTENDDYYSYRLATEVEWEWAARGAVSSDNYKFSGSSASTEVANHKTGTSAWESISQIGSKYPNELGIYDMSGNLWEFVSDRSDYNWTASNHDYISEPKGYFAWCGNNIVDPTGPRTSDGTFSMLEGKSSDYYCIRKGGSANEPSGSTCFCPGYRRTDNNTKTYSHVTTGFRIVRVAKNR